MQSKWQLARTPSWIILQFFHTKNFPTNNYISSKCKINININYINHTLYWNKQYLQSQMAIGWDAMKKLCEACRMHICCFYQSTESSPKKFISPQQRRMRGKLHYRLLVCKASHWSCNRLPAEKPYVSIRHFYQI